MQTLSVVRATPRLCRSNRRTPSSAFSHIISALLVGGTFMDTATIAMPAARRVAGTVRFNILLIMTAAYGVGQILGSLVAGVLHAKTNSFDSSLAIAAVALLVATALCIPRRAIS
jgi:predicted MFS family arabinose efflux permease